MKQVSTYWMSKTRNCSGEKMQARTNYPKAAAHKQTHVDFVNSYKNLKSEYDKSGGSPILLMKLSQAALAWLKNHIRVEDREFAKFYLAASAGK
jgi:Hemerythrin